MKIDLSRLFLAAVFLAMSTAAQADLQEANEAFARGDYAAALKEFKQLAVNGDARAQYNLGLMYDNGQGIARDAKQAVLWYQKAADRGLAEAQLRLGFAYNFGYGVVQDRVIAASLYRKAAEQGLAEAQLKLAGSYSEGWGVNKDPKQHFYWLGKAAEQGDPVAQNGLARCFYFGDGTPQNYQQALKWFLKAVDQRGIDSLSQLGVIDSQYLLGTMFEKGYGVRKDLVEAHKWYNIAAVDAELDLLQHSAKARDAIEKLMTLEQVTEAQRRASEWMNTHQK